MPIQVDKIRTLYTQYKPNIRIDTNVSDEEMLTRLESNPPQGFDLQSLCSYSQEATLERAWLSALFAQLPHEAIINEAGKDPLIWAWIHYPYANEVKENLGTNLSNLTGIRTNLLERAATKARDLHATTKLDTSYLFSFIITILNNILEQKTNLPELLKQCAHKGIELKEKRIKDYDLELLFTYGDSGYEKTLENKKTPDGKKEYAIYLDVPFAIGLMYKRQPNGFLGFKLADLDPKTLFITQIQGVRSGHQSSEQRSHSRGLIVLDWEKLLVTITERAAKESGIEKTIIQSSRNNKYRDWDDSIRKRLRFWRRYNKTARRLGYTKMSGGNWVKSLNEAEDQKVSFWSRVVWQKARSYIPFLTTPPSQT